MNLSKRGYSVQSGYAPGFIFTPHQVARCTPTRAATIFFDALQARRGYAPGFVLTPHQMARLTPAQAATIFFDDLQAQQMDFDGIPERTILLQDRWAESAYVYQGLVDAASDGELRDAIYRRARQMTAPDLTIYLRVSPQIAAERIAERDGATPNIERLSDVIDAYDRLYRDSCSKFPYIAQIWSPSHVSGIWEQPVYRPLARAQFDEVVETVANLIIDKWKEKY